MKKLINNKWFIISIIIVVVILTPIILSQIIRIPTGRFTIGAEDSWVGFFGNYSGGVIGGIVAYLIAKYQLDKQNKKEFIQTYSKELPVYISLRLEFEKIIEHLSELIKILEQYKKKYNLEAITQEMYYGTVKFDGIQWTRWEGMWKISDPILLSELLKFEESFRRTVEVLEFDIDGLKQEIQTLNEKIMENKTLDVELIFSNFIKQQDALKLMEQEKIHYWGELKYCKEKAQLIKSKILEREEKLIELISKEKTDSQNLTFSNFDEFKVNREAK